MAKKETTKKVIKKAAPKTSVKTRTQVQSAAIVSKTPEKKATPTKNRVLKTRKAYIILAVLIVVLGALLFAGRGLFVAAVVNGQPISRLSIVHESEKQSGKQALETIIRNTLIEQEARKANITVSDAEVDSEVKKIETQITKQGRNFNELLAMNGLTRDDLRKDFRLKKIVEKVVGKDVKVSDKEIDEYIAQNKETMPQDQSEEQLRKTAADAVRQTKLNEKVQTWLQSIQAKAKIIYFVQY